GIAGLLDDVGAGVDQRPQHRFVTNDAGVVLGVGGRGYLLAQLEQIGGAANSVKIAGIFKQLQQELQFDRFAVVVERDDVAVDAGVGVVVEVVGANNERDFVTHFGQEQQAAENGALGLNAARRLAVEKLAHRE